MKIILLLCVMLFCNGVGAVTFRVEHEKSTRELNFTENNITDEIDGTGNTVVVGFASRNNRFHYEVSYTREAASSTQFDEDFSVEGLSLQASMYKKTDAGNYVSYLVGLSKISYNFYGQIEPDYLGWKLGLSGGMPLVSNKLILTGSIDYNILAESGTSDNNNESDLSGLKGEVGLTYVIARNFAFRVGYRARKFDGSDDSRIKFDDNSRGTFISLKFSPE